MLQWVGNTGKNVRERKIRRVVRKCGATGAAKKLTDKHKSVINIVKRENESWMSWKKLLLGDFTLLVFLYAVVFTRISISVFFALLKSACIFPLLIQIIFWFLLLPFCLPRSNLRFDYPALLLFVSRLNTQQQQSENIFSMNLFFPFKIFADF